MSHYLFGQLQDVAALVGGLVIRLLIGAGAFALLAVPAVALVLVWMAVTHVRSGVHRRHTHHVG
jgi:hypothetical protein